MANSVSAPSKKGCIDSDVPLIKLIRQTAPRIVETINLLPDAMEIWNRIYEELVKPCVQMIYANKNAEAHQLYKSYATKLAHSYLETDG